MFCILAGTLIAVSAMSARFLSLQHHSLVVTPGRIDWRLAWANWDGAWYREIARKGYSYARRRQSSVAFFPAYPLALRAGSALVGHVVLTGLAITTASSLAAVLLFRTWLQQRVTRAALVPALLLLLLYPYAFFLYGTLYADALFVAAALGAFVLLERGHPYWAGLVGVVATAARPVGVVVVVGLVARAIELQDASRDDAPVRPDPGKHAVQAQSADRRWLAPTWRPVVGVALSALGLATYMAYLWWRFGNPIAFVTAERGWHQTPGPATWFKIGFFSGLWHAPSFFRALVLLAHPVVTVGALALVPRVIRRFGRAYGLYALLVIALPALSTKDFFGMGRYALAAFPCFAVAGEMLAARPGVRRLALGSSGALLIVFTSLFARGYYLS